MSATIEIVCNVNTVASMFCCNNGGLKYSSHNLVECRREDSLCLNTILGSVWFHISDCVDNGISAFFYILFSSSYSYYSYFSFTLFFFSKYSSFVFLLLLLFIFYFSALRLWLYSRNLLLQSIIALFT